MLKKALVVASSILLLTIGGPAFSSTADGETPSRETVCNVYKGTSNGAFGLCNAYCQAIDCGDPMQNANNQACTRINDKFEKRFGMRLPEGFNYDANGDPIGNNCAIDDGDDGDGGGDT